MGDAPAVSPLAELLIAFKKARIEYQIAGMSAAILQGVPATTLDTDIWIGLPERQYVKVLDICRNLGGKILASTVVALRDDNMINFLYRVDGLRGFASERENALRVSWLGMRVPVLPLKRILKSKKFVGRAKDLAHVPLLEETIRLQGKKTN